VEHVANKFAISYGTAQGNMTDRLGMRRVSAGWVPRFLTSEQMRVRVKGVSSTTGGIVKKAITF
jgi:hypothetical protein